PLPDLNVAPDVLKRYPLVVLPPGNVVVDATAVTAAMRLESAACHRECVIQTANPNHYHVTLHRNVYPFELHQHASWSKDSAFFGWAAIFLVSVGPHSRHYCFAGDKIPLLTRCPSNHRGMLCRLELLELMPD